MTIIKPEEKFCDYLDNIFVMGFKQVGNYFIIQREDENPENFHIELNDQGKGCYNGLSEIIIEDNGISFKLNQLGKEFLKTEVVLIVDSIKDNQAYDRFRKEIANLNRWLRKSST